MCQSVSRLVVYRGSRYGAVVYTQAMSRKGSSSSLIVDVNFCLFGISVKSQSFESVEERYLNQPPPPPLSLGFTGSRLSPLC